jgi:hypothetical protein
MGSVMIFPHKYVVNFAARPQWENLSIVDRSQPLGK